MLLRPLHLYLSILHSTQVKESKRQFIFDVVNEGGEKEKMELFVNFCEDTIFEMQLAAQMSDAGERLAMKEDGEREKSEEDSADAGFFSMSTVYMALLALRYNLLLLIKVGSQTAPGLTKQPDSLHVVNFVGCAVCVLLTNVLIVKVKKFYNKS